MEALITPDATIQLDLLQAPMVVEKGVNCHEVSAEAVTWFSQYTPQRRPTEMLAAPMDGLQRTPDDAERLRLKQKQPAASS